MKSITPKKKVTKGFDKLKIYEWFYAQLNILVKEANLALSAKGHEDIYLGEIKLEKSNTNTKK